MQVAFLQSGGSQVAQTANIAAGTYTLSIRAAQRGNYQSGTQVLQVLVDGVPVGQYQPPSTAYTNYQTPAFTIATTGSHTLSLAGIGTGSDFTAFVDDVRLTSTVVVTYALSGTVTTGGNPLSGVSFAAPGSLCTASNAQGQYSCTVPQGWSGSVTPALSGYTFTPAARNYSSVAANQTGQNYTATNVGHDDDDADELRQPGPGGQQRDLHRHRHRQQSHRQRHLHRGRQCDLCGGHAQRQPTHRLVQHQQPRRRRAQHRRQLRR